MENLEDGTDSVLKEILAKFVKRWFYSYQSKVWFGLTFFSPLKPLNGVNLFCTGKESEKLKAVIRTNISPQIKAVVWSKKVQKDSFSFPWD